MKVLVLGVGRQGKAAIYDLEKSPLVSDILAVDFDPGPVRAFIDRFGLTKVEPVRCDAGNESELLALIKRTGPRVVLCLLPSSMSFRAAGAALEAGVSFVDTSYAGRLPELDGEAKARGVTILPEMGLDPGIDLFLGALAVQDLDEVHGMYSYGTGVPEPASADNPLNYKIAWTFQGVLNAYRRPARLLKDGAEAVISPGHIFNDENVHQVDIPDVGIMEAYPNGDAVDYVEAFGLGPHLKHMGRFSMRWPGHCRFWKTMSDLGFLEDDPVSVDGHPISPFKFLVEHLGPRLQYRERERDLVVLRVHAWGVKDGRQVSIIYELVDYRDLETGFFAMNRTVGFTASIAVQMILDGTVTETGVLSPVRHVPAQAVLEALEQRDIRINHRWEG